MVNQKVTIVQVVYNSRKWIPAVFDAIFKQTFKDFNVVVVIAGSVDGSKEYIAEHYPAVEIIDPGYNIGFAKGHNLVFEKYESEFFMLVNPDMIMQSNYVEEILKVFADGKVGAATGKLYNIPAYAFALSYAELEKLKPSLKVLDTTGLVYKKSGRIRDRGQHELDMGQYDLQIQTQGVCAAGAMYRKAALEAVKEESGYFDSDFNTTYEDVDLSWRLRNKTWKNVFVPTAVGFHARGAAGTVGGYKKIFDFIKYHKKLNPFIRKHSYKNHIFAYIKNSPWFYPQFFVREFFMLLYILLFEISTLKVMPEMFRLLPKMWGKRKLINEIGRN
jgi:GT2 family glycosyltransferase